MELSLSKIIAHRGAPRFAPENTLASLEMAKAHGAEWTEFDVTLSADNVVVVFHDNTLDRTTNGHGKITKKTYSELQALDAGSWFAPQFHTCKIPTLEEYIKFAAKLNLAINVELKTIGLKRIKQLVISVLAILNEHWPKELPPPLLSSFSIANLKMLRKLNCRYPIALNCAKPRRRKLSLAKKLGCYSIHCSKKHITPKVVLVNTKNNCKTLSYTVNDPNEAAALFNMGVTAIFSDIPDLSIGCTSSKNECISYLSHK